MPKNSKKLSKKIEAQKKSHSLRLRETKVSNTDEEQVFCWNLSEVDSEGTWSVNQLTLAEFCYQVWTKIHRFNGMKWANIMGDNLFHFTPVSKIDSEARVRFCSLYSKEADMGERLFSVRLESRKRIWAIQRGNEGCVIWYDPDHSVYQVKRK